MDMSQSITIIITMKRKTNEEDETICTSYHNGGGDIINSIVGVDMDINAGIESKRELALRLMDGEVFYSDITHITNWKHATPVVKEDL